MPARLTVSHVLMAVDPSTPAALDALNLARGLAEHSVRTTLACLKKPISYYAKEAARIPGLDIRTGASEGSIEWILFLETQAEPELIQLYDSEHVLLPWRSPTVLQVSDSALVHPTRELMEASALANLVVVQNEACFDKLQTLVGAGPFIAVLPSDMNCGWNYYLAYEEIVQALRLDLAEESAGRFELI